MGCARRLEDVRRFNSTFTAHLTGIVLAATECGRIICLLIGQLREVVSHVDLVA